MPLHLHQLLRLITRDACFDDRSTAFLRVLSLKEKFNGDSSPSSALGTNQKDDSGLMKAQMSPSRSFVLIV